MSEYLLRIHLEAMPPGPTFFVKGGYNPSDAGGTAGGPSAGRENPPPSGDPIDHACAREGRLPASGDLHDDLRSVFCGFWLLGT